jgi:serine/threonine-protein kinase
MNDSRWQQIQDIFEAACQCSPAERDAFLDEACGEDAELRAEVVSLLAADAGDDAVLETGRVGEAAEALLSMEGRRVGPYRIVRKLGEGGMGAVYLAERDDGQFEQTVALKLLRAGVASRRVLERFAEERQILARLEHPNIARLLDGGVSEEGHPFFALEYVDGQPIDAWSDDRRLSIDERLRIFLTVCDAVRYAHGQLVVHRDIKPDNILVAQDDQGRPVVKLLDFGIAKLLETDREALTRTSIPLTPAYASPEQVKGEPVSTATDVYSLGMILYGLLTGARPYEVSSTNPVEIAQAIATSNPTRPSSAGDRETLASASRARSTRPERLRKRLEGDLDVICLKALRKEPERRYGSVEALQDDVRRHLDGLPITARSDTLGYRARKFVRRNARGLAASAAFLLVLGATATYYTGRLQTERDRAQIEAETAEQVVAFMEELFENADPEEARGEEITVRQVMDEGAVRLQSELANQPAVRARLLDVMGGVYRTLKASEEAEAVLLQAVEDWERVGEAGAAGLTESLSKLGAVQGQLMKQDEAVASYERALEIARVTEGDPSLKVAELLNNLSLIESQRGDLVRMEALLRESIAMEEALAEDGRTRSGGKLFNLGYVTQYSGRYDEAIELYERSRELLALEYGEDHPRVLYPMQALAVLYTEIGDYDDADLLMGEVLDRTRSIYGEDSVDYGFALSDMGRIRSGQERYDEAEALLVEAIKVLRRAYDGPHPNVASVIETLGMHHYQMENWAAGAAVFREALAMRELVLEPPHPDLSNNMGNLGLLLKKSGQLEEAESLYRRALAMDREMFGEEHREVATSLYNIALIREALGDLDTAESLHQEALAMRRRLFGDVHDHIAVSLNGLGGLEQRRGDPAAARPYLQEAYAVRLALQDGDESHPSVVSARAALDDLETSQGSSSD